MERIEGLAKLFITIHSEKEMGEFLDGLLTPKEVLELSTRLEIVRRLKKGLPQRQIAEELKVGIATVSRGAKELQKGKFAYV